MQSFLVGVVAGYGIAIPVGAIAVLIVQVGVRCGFSCAACAGAGAATADLAYAVLAVTGGAALAGVVGAVGAPLRWISAAVLAVVAVHGLVRARRPPAEMTTALPRRRERLRTYVTFLGLTIVNPMTVVYFAAVVVGLGVADDIAGWQATLFVAGAFLASLSWQLLLAVVGAVAHRRLPERFIAGAVVGGNLLVLTLAVLIALR